MVFVRYVLPAAIFCIAQLVLILGGGSSTAVEGWAMLTGAALAIFIFNLLLRIGVKGDEERDIEDEARAYFDRHGRWPDEQRPR